jgi:hypothetical protein
MTSASRAATDRVGERRRAVALAHHYRAFEGLTIQQIADPVGPRAGDREGVLLRPDGGKGASGQGTLRRPVPGLWRLHAAPQRQGRRLRVLQGLPSGRD